MKLDTTPPMAMIIEMKEQAHQALASRSITSLSKNLKPSPRLEYKSGTMTMDRNSKTKTAMSTALRAMLIIVDRASLKNMKMRPPRPAAKKIMEIRLKARPVLVPWQKLQNSLVSKLQAKSNTLLEHNDLK